MECEIWLHCQMPKPKVIEPVNDFSCIYYHKIYGKYANKVQNI